MKYRVTSETDKSKKYIVEHWPQADKWMCECPAYSFAKAGADCKHIKKVKVYLKKKGESK